MSALFSLRTATLDDAPACAALHMHVFPAGWEAGEFTRLFECGAGGVVAKENARSSIAGFVLFRQAADEAEILTIAVDAVYRRQGLATELLAACVQMLQEKGVQRLFLEVDVTNQPALALYAKAGFYRVGIRKAYYPTAHGVAHDAMVMERELEK